MTVKLTILYDGTHFYGYERQNDLRTIQGELELALAKLYNTEIKTTASGRTDAGVHALGQVVSYQTDKEYTTERITAALNSFLLQDIRIKKAEYADNDFNARKNAISKTYYYDFYISENENPLLCTRACRLSPNLDFELMAKCAKLFEGTHDFSNFYCLGSSAKTTTRTISSCGLLGSQNSIASDDSAELVPHVDLVPTTMYGENILRLSITANGFLYKMVRLIAGALIKASEGKLTYAQIKNFIDNTQVYNNKVPAPACGLYLYKVEYM